MNVLELREYLLEFLQKKYSTGDKAKYVEDFTFKYIMETKQHEIPVIDIYNSLDVKVSYNYFIKALNKKWKLEKIKGGRLLLNTKYQRTRQ
jgi:hypothetical protein